MTSDVVRAPITGIKDALRWRDSLAEEITKLVIEYEKRVPFTKVESIQISRTVKRTKIGTSHQTASALIRVVLGD